MQSSQSLPEPPSGTSANPLPDPSPWEMPGPSLYLHLHHLPLTLLDWQLPHFTEEAEAQEKLPAQGHVGYKLQGQDPICFCSLGTECSSCKAVPGPGPPEDGPDLHPYTPWSGQGWCHMVSLCISGQDGTVRSASWKRLETLTPEDTS